MEMEKNQHIKLSTNADLTWRDVNGELVALDINTGAYHVFNEVGRLIWLGISEHKTKEELIKQITDEFDTQEQKAIEDIDSFVNDLLQRGLLQITKNQDV